METTLQKKNINDIGPGYVIQDGCIYTWEKGWPRYVNADEPIFVKDYGCGWYNRGKDTPENRDKWGIPEKD